MRIAAWMGLGVAFLAGCAGAPPSDSDISADDDAALSDTITRWWNCPGPALLHAICQLEENVFPMVPAGAGLGEMVESA